MRTIDVAELLFDDENEAKFTARGITVQQVAEVHQSAPEFRKNRAKRRASHLMVGQTFGGRWLIVPIERYGSEGIWRPVTAFEATKSQLAQVRSKR